MENAIPYCGDLHMDAGTKKLILNLLSSIRSVVPVEDPPGPHSPGEDPGLKTMEDIRNVLILARQNSEELDGIFNPDELMRYTRYVNDYQDIMTNLEKILDQMRVCRNSALQFASSMAEIVEDHLHMTSLTSVDAKEGESERRILIGQKGIKLKVV